MDFVTYQQIAVSTSAFAGQQTAERQIVAALGLVGEIGELADLLKKTLGHGHDFDPATIQDEMGDVLWYVAEMCSAFGVMLTYSLPRFAAPALDLHWLSVWMLTLAGSAGRIADKIGDQVADPRRKVGPGWIAGQMTDVLDALRNAADCAGLSLADIAAANVAKLAARYPDGFSSARSRARYDGAA
jgi:NTP pyrophosphatase (non-canonical NTP hydrolase)